MGTDWLIEFMWGTAKLFVNPLFYYAFFLCLVMGFRRVKRERKDFKIRAESGYFEMQNMLPAGVVIGLILSLATIGTGTVIPFAAIIVMTAVTVLLSLTMRFRWLSAAYVIGLSVFVLFFLYEQNGIEIPFLSGYIEDMDASLIPVLAVMMGLLMVAEGILIRRNASKGTSPRMITSNRGMAVGSHYAQRLWMVPIFVFIPGGELPAPFEWWPVYGMGDISVAPLLFPFLIGFTQHVKSELPKHAITATGERVAGLGAAVLAIAIASIWMPIFTIAAAAVAILGRESIHYSSKMADQKKPFYFTRRNNGVLILGITPFSPAEKMGLTIGEVITKVNGMEVRTESELYQALQKNAAHCRLEVLDTKGEIRLMQRALYEGEHHELGILFVEDKSVHELAV